MTFEKKKTLHTIEIDIFGRAVHFEAVSVRPRG